MAPIMGASQPKASFADSALHASCPSSPWSASPNSLSMLHALHIELPTRRAELRAMARHADSALRTPPPPNAGLRPGLQKELSRRGELSAVGLDILEKVAAFAVDNHTRIEQPNTRKIEAFFSDQSSEIKQPKFPTLLEAMPLVSSAHIALVKKAHNPAQLPVRPRPSSIATMPTVCAAEDEPAKVDFQICASLFEEHVSVLTLDPGLPAKKRPILAQELDASRKQVFKQDVPLKKRVAEFLLQESSKIVPEHFAAMSA